jgi:hypothetical protein
MAYNEDVWIRLSEKEASALADFLEGVTIEARQVQWLDESNSTDRLRDLLDAFRVLEDSLGCKVNLLKERNE